MFTTHPAPSPPCPNQERFTHSVTCLPPPTSRPVPTGFLFEILSIPTASSPKPSQYSNTPSMAFLTCRARLRASRAFHRPFSFCYTSDSPPDCVLPEGRGCMSDTSALPTLSSSERELGKGSSMKEPEIVFQQAKHSALCLQPGLVKSEAGQHRVNAEPSPSRPQTLPSSGYAH